MNIAFLSNTLNQHQKPFSDAMSNIEKSYKFIETVPMNSERKKMGWDVETAPYLLRRYDGDDSRKECDRVIEKYDVIIYGSASDKLVAKRIKKNKITIKCAERFYKQKLTLKNLIHVYLGAWIHYRQFQNYKMYLLCCSAYTPIDCNVFCDFKGRMYKWGYFPAVKYYEDIEQIIKNKVSFSILWVGRIIEWKHLEVAIQIAIRLKKEGIPFKLNIIGTGTLEQLIQENIYKNKLEDEVHMLGSMSPAQVRVYMEESQIFLFTSDRNEGWGAVLNESMNSGCAVIASHAIGSVPFLIKNRINGLVYEDGNIDDLYEKVKWIMRNEIEREAMAQQAYYTISAMWSPEIAAQRLQILLRELVKKGDCELFQDGPCSKADIIKGDWYK